MPTSVKYLVLFSLFATNLVEQPSPVVKLNQGEVVGKISTDGTFYEYLGIPYASVNRHKRFQPPLPPPSWTGTYKAVDEHHSCLQKSPVLGVTGEEDCLKANIYVPVNAKKPLAVMVYIHGGAFLIGSGGKVIYSPEFLVKHDVILVTFNYRLGALGFICLGINEAPGNAGLRDQIAALKWVKENIAAFGGDPDNITLFGESAGSTSTSFMVISNLTDGLFHRAILQSGTSTSNWGINRNPVKTSSLLVEVLGYNRTEDPYELYDILSKVPINDLIVAKTQKPKDVFFETELIHIPCIEKPIPGIDPVVSDVPYNLLTSSSRKNISVIYGTNSKEGIFLLMEQNETKLRERNEGYMFASDLEFSSVEEAKSVAKKVNEFYFGNELISLKTILNVSEIYSDLYFEMPALMESEVLLDNPNVSVYNYYFNYDGGRNGVKYLSSYKNVSGAFHGDEVLYLFDGKIWPFPTKSEDQLMINRMTKMWTNFAKYGNPTPADNNDIPLTWLPSKKGDIQFLYIDKQFKMGPMPKRKSYELWKNIYKKYRKKTWGY